MANARVNPYRLGGNYNSLFGHLMTLGIRTITFNELLDWGVENLGMIRGTDNNTCGNASVGVILSPREESAEGFEVKECRGNWSSNGHLYYMERLARRMVKNADGNDVLEPANDIRMRLKWRETPLPKLTKDNAGFTAEEVAARDARKAAAKAKRDAIKAAAQAELEHKRELRWIKAEQKRQDAADLKEIKAKARLVKQGEAEAAAVAAKLAVVVRKAEREAYKMVAAEQKAIDDAANAEAKATKAAEKLAAAAKLKAEKDAAREVKRLARLKVEADKKAAKDAKVAAKQAIADAKQAELDAATEAEAEAAEAAEAIEVESETDESETVAETAEDSETAEVSG
jgi:hypothetical protein